MRLDHLLSMENVVSLKREDTVFNRKTDGEMTRRDCCSIFRDQAEKSVIQTQRVHPYPFRTRKLSSAVPRVLRWRRRGRVGHGRHRIPVPLRDAREENPYGGVAQLGEHLPCKQGVMGSNPIISTNGSDQGASSAATESHHPSSIGKSTTK